jgi:hypothetical protein
VLQRREDRAVVIDEPVDDRVERGGRPEPKQIGTLLEA